MGRRVGTLTGQAQAADCRRAVGGLGRQVDSGHCFPVMSSFVVPPRWRACLCLGAERHSSAHQLAHHPAGQPKHGGLVHGRVLVQHSLNLGGCRGGRHAGLKNAVRETAGMPWLTIKAASSGPVCRRAGNCRFPRPRSPSCRSNVPTLLRTWLRLHLQQATSPKPSPPFPATHCTHSLRPQGACPSCDRPLVCSPKARRWPGRPSCRGRGAKKARLSR